MRERPAPGRSSTVPSGEEPASIAAALHPRDTVLDSLTVGAYFAAFSPAPAWDELCAWPPDVFALANLVLDHTEAYRLAVSPPAGRRWPPAGDWHQKVTEAAAAWREAVVGRCGLPALVAEQWEVVTRHRDLPLHSLRRGEAHQVAVALLTLHAVADEACSGLAGPWFRIGSASFEHRAWRLMDEQGSLARLSPARVRIIPKTQFSMRGITIRSLSRYLALVYEAVDIRWRRIEAGTRWHTATARDFNLVLIPWPLEIAARDFRPIAGPLDMDPSAFGFFEFSPVDRIDLEMVDRVLAAASREAARVDALILPEGAVEEDDIDPLERLAANHGLTFLVAGVRRPASSGALGGNYAHFGVLTTEGWERFRQAKHHRWCLDEQQIRQYHLCRVLEPGKVWWEGIELSPRTLEVIDLGGGGTIAPLVCEDLARMDEVTELLRRLGPSFVVALLLDGPQLAARWPCRYASVLADEPGAAVLTLTSLGMAFRSRPPGKKASRAIALWRDPTTGLRQLDLERGASALLVTTSVSPKVVWTADGRCHRKYSPAVILSGVHQLRGSPRTALRRRRDGAVPDLRPEGGSHAHGE